MYLLKDSSLGFAALLGVGAFAAMAFAQAPAAAPFATHQLKPNVYRVEGGGEGVPSTNRYAARRPISICSSASAVNKY